MTSFEDRRRNYIALNKNNKSEYSIPLKIYNNERISPEALDKLYSAYKKQKTDNKDTDFTMLLIIRVLYLSANNKSQQLDIFNKFNAEYGLKYTVHYNFISKIIFKPL
jgi:hypothetical protein